MQVSNSEASNELWLSPIGGAHLPDHSFQRQGGPCRWMKFPTARGGGLAVGFVQLEHKRVRRGNKNTAVGESKWPSEPWGRHKNALPSAKHRTGHEESTWPVPCRAFPTARPPPPCRWICPVTAQRSPEGYEITAVGDSKCPSGPWHRSQFALPSAKCRTGHANIDLAWSLTGHVG